MSSMRIVVVVLSLLGVENLFAVATGAVQQTWGINAGFFYEGMEKWTGWPLSKWFATLMVGFQYTSNPNYGVKMSS